MARVAKALVSTTDKGKVPFMYLACIYMIPLAILMATSWLWHMFIPAVLLHLALKVVYKKDEHMIRYFIKEMTSPEVLEP